MRSSGKGERPSSLVRRFRAPDSINRLTRDTYDLPAHTTHTTGGGYNNPLRSYPCFFYRRSNASFVLQTVLTQGGYQFNLRSDASARQTQPGCFARHLPSTCTHCSPRSWLQQSMTAYPRFLILLVDLWPDDCWSLRSSEHTGRPLQPLVRRFFCAFRLELIDSRYLLSTCAHHCAHHGAGHNKPVRTGYPCL